MRICFETESLGLNPCLHAGQAKLKLTALGGTTKVCPHSGQLTDLFTTPLNESNSDIYGRITGQISGIKAFKLSNDSAPNEERRDRANASAEKSIAGPISKSPG